MTVFRVTWTHLSNDVATPRDAAHDIRARYFQLTEADHFEVQENSAARFGARREIVTLSDPPETDQTVWRHTPQSLHRMAKRILAEGGDAAEIIDMLERPWKWNDVLTAAILEDEVSAVSTTPEEIDVLGE